MGTVEQSGNKEENTSHLVITEEVEFRHLLDSIIAITPHTKYLILSLNHIVSVMICNADNS